MNFADKLFGTRNGETEKKVNSRYTKRKFADSRPTSYNWYVVNTNPRCEELVSTLLKKEDIEVFLPRLNNNPQKSEPLFPGYLFIKLNSHHPDWSKINYLQGVRKLISFGGRPVPVAKKIVNLIGYGLEKRGYVIRKLNLLPGDRVRFNKGHLAGLEGKFTGETSGKERVKVLLETIYKQFTVEADAAMLSKVG